MGIAGEGSDCFGYDDLISRDHDFGTGVCLWLTDRDYEEYGSRLSAEYNRLIEKKTDPYYTERLRERRGVMTIHDFYSNILCVDCDTDRCVMPEEKWYSLDHTCLATAVNGEVFRDDPGEFSRFRALLLDYYPDRIWRWRLAEELHWFSSALQVNYARCMTRGDTVAADICRSRGLNAAMELYFLIRRVYPPYYKWIFRALKELDRDSVYSGLIKNLSEIRCDLNFWKSTEYRPDRINMADPVVRLTEETAKHVVTMLRETGLISAGDPYLERYVNVVLQR